MSKIESFHKLVHDEVPGVRWKEWRPKLDEADRLLRAKGHLMA